ncbi:MAG: hypothetical protein QOD75_3278 [Blastocatellia bacterium]|jgi:hypothetical protein|nr:hypothetical protein [Blastocatellia bacterium]
MKSEMLGTDTSEVEVSHISKHGVWLLLRDREVFMPYDQFPWFKKASLCPPFLMFSYLSQDISSGQTSMSTSQSNRSNTQNGFLLLPNSVRTFVSLSQTKLFSNQSSSQQIQHSLRSAPPYQMAIARKR